jgi:hypothetical protein
MKIKNKEILSKELTLVNLNKRLSKLEKFIEKLELKEKEKIKEQHARDKLKASVLKGWLAVYNANLKKHQLENKK